MGFVCAVCRKTLSTENRMSLAPCGHVAHHQCWMTRSNSCSLCPRCSRTFWRDYLKPVHLEEEESSTESFPTQIVQATSSSSTTAPNPVEVAIHNLNQQLEALRNIVHRKEQTHTEWNEEKFTIKTEASDTCGNTPSTIINPNIDWNSLENCTIEQDGGQQQVGQIVGQLASAVLPASFSFKSACTEKISESVKKFSSDGKGFEINLSMRKRPRYQKIFRLDLDMSDGVRSGGDGSVILKEQVLTEIELNLSEPGEKVQKIKFSMNTD